MSFFDKLFHSSKNETTENIEPQNETERWILGTYAMWSQATGGDWNYFAGTKNPKKGDRWSMRVMLRRDWEITNKEQLFEMVEYLKADTEDEACAWDLCRACQILGMAYVGTWITREEMMKESIVVGQIIQKRFSSWKELYESYIKGYTLWRIQIGNDAEKAIQERKNLCEKLLLAADGPNTLDWNRKLL